ncbi:MAG: hypothetical protein CME62_10755 [Halobacteriovoraceae bacterium]|nr:hypothetical protein [Halobacteriovoraceae bacterium]
MNQTGPTPKFQTSIGRLFFMGVLSILFCLSGFLSVFTPLPVGISSLLFGRGMAIGLALVASAVFFTIIQKLSSDMTVGNLSFGYFFMLYMIVGVSLSEIIHRKLHPIRGVLWVGGLIIAFIGLCLWGYLASQNLSLHEFVLGHVQEFSKTLEGSLAEVKKTNYEGAQEIETLIKQPEILVNKIITTGPGYFIVGIYALTWINMYLMLLFRRILAPQKAGYSEKSLLKFKVPEKFIFGVILGLVMVVLGGQIGQNVVDLGYFLLMVLGVFYFFHGIGIYLEFLDYVRITGFLRSILIVLTLLTAYQLIALIGVFDMFVNFRKFFKRKNNNN